MRKSIGLLILLLAIVAPVSQGAIVVVGDGVNAYAAATENDEGHFDDHDDWGDSGWRVLDGSTSSVPTGWKFAQQSWNNSNNYHVAADTSFKTEGTASMKITPGSGGYNDAFVGRMLSGLQVGAVYIISFDFQADTGFVSQNGPGAGTGDDHVNSASWNVMAVADSPQGWGATEDYPGHETGSTWINNAADWDGQFHAQSGTFVATAPSMAFVMKIRSMDPSGDPSMRLDNLVVTPEPVSLAMLAMGGLVCLRRRR